jgi:hypothetical protein
LEKCLFILTLLIATPLLAQRTCFATLIQQRNTLNHLQVYQNDRFKLAHLTPGSYGGHNVLLELWDPNQSWKLPPLAKNKYDNAYPGNIIWFLRSMPPEISDYYEYRGLDKNRKPILRDAENFKPWFVQIPDVLSINGSTRNLNKWLELEGLDPIPYLFSPDEGTSKHESFLRRLYKLRNWSYSLDNQSSYHDFNYHFSPLFVLRQNLVKHADLINEIYIEFANWLKKNHPGLATEGLIDRIYYLRANQVDRLANLAIHLQDPNEVSYKDDAFFALRDFGGGGRPAIKSFEARIKFGLKAFPELVTMNPEMVEVFSQTLGPQYRKSNPELIDFLSDFKEIEKDLQMRLIEIQKVIIKNAKPKTR